MIWYTAHYGTWRDPAGVVRIKFPLENGNGEGPGTFRYRWAMETAQAVADRVGKPVTVCAEIPTGYGCAYRSYKVEPRRTGT